MKIPHLVITSLLFGMGAALLYGVQQTLGEAQVLLRPSLVVTAFIAPSVPDADAAKLESAVKTADSEIQSVGLITQEAAYQQALHDPILSKSLMILKDNPLPASLSITYSDKAWTQRTQPADNLRTFKEIEDLRWDSAARSVFRSLAQWRQWLFRFELLAAAVLLVWSVIGLYWFFAKHCPIAALCRDILTGLAGGALALGIWAIALRSLGMDAAAYRPAAFSILPLVIGAVVGLASFGWGESFER